MLGVAAGEVGNLHSLAKCTDVHGLPTGDGHHPAEKLASRTANVHISCDVPVLLDTLLEDPDAVLVTTHGIVGVLH